MRIGSDFEKIEWDFLGFHFLEPNAFIGDTIIFILTMILVAKTIRLKEETTFFKNWIRFYFVFGFGFFIGGFGHLLYNYVGFYGKFPSYFAGILAVYFIEQAMLSIHPNQKHKKILNKISGFKLILAFLLEIYICSIVDLESFPSKGLALPTINSVIGMGFSLGYLGYLYEKRIHSSFRYLWISTFILIPSAIFQALKINLHPWMDRNDFSHVLLIVSILLYYKCIKRFSIYVSQNRELV